MMIVKFLIFTTVLCMSMLRADDVVHLNYWVLFSGGDGRPMQLMVDKFNASNKDINVKMRVIKWAEYYKALNESLNTKNSPDIGIIHASLLPFYVNQNSLVDITPYDIEWKNLPSHLLDAVRFENKYYALPLDMHPQVFYFNKKYLAQAHLLDENSQPMIGNGVDGFIAFLQKLHQSLPSDTLPLSTPNSNVLPWWLWYSIYTQQENSGYIVNNRVAFNNEAGKKAFEFFYKMREAKIWDEEIHDERGYNLFKFNKAATMITGVWATWNFQQNKELDFGVTKFPKLFDKNANFGDSHTFAVLKTDNLAKQKASVTFIKWISENSFDWALSGQVPANKHVIETQEFKNLPFRETYVQSANEMALYPKNLKLQQCNEAMIKILVAFLRNNDSVEETMLKAEKTLNEILQHPLKK